MPVIWLIDAYRVGEREQVRALVNALDGSVWRKVLRYKKAVVWPHLLGQSSLAGISRDSIAQLKPPWPDLLITCGVRNEPVCRWIREQSGGQTRYIHVGKPWAALDSFDLVITTPQYRVPDRPNVLNNLMTLHTVDEQRLAAARQRWAQPFSSLPGPYFTVVVGGDSGPFTLGPKAADRLGREASQIARTQGGSLLVTTSSRTSESATQALQDAIDVPLYFYRWSPHRDENPYLGMLAWADRVIVTGDSIGMISEACATGKPVRLFDIGGMRPGSVPEDRDFRLGGTLYAALMRWGWRPLTRDITLVHTRLREEGYAMWLDDVLAGAHIPAQNDLERSVAAVESLLREV